MDYRLQHFLQSVFLIAATLLLTLGTGHTGVFIKGAKMATKYAGKKLAREAVETGVSKGVRKLAKRYGDEAAQVVTRVAMRTKQNADDVARLVLKEKYCRRVPCKLPADMLEFAVREGEPGRFLIRRFGFGSLKKHGWTNPGTDNVIKEAWQLVDPKSIGGSWKALRNALQNANINGPGRDFAETLFANRAKAGRIPGIPKGADLLTGHTTKRQGIDFLLPSKDGTLRIIEFSTGKKPSGINANQMSWDWVRKNLSEYLEHAPKDQLRGKGFPRELLDPRNLSNPKFPIDKYVSREFYATEFDRKGLARLGIPREKVVTLH